MPRVRQAAESGEPGAPPRHQARRRGDTLPRVHRLPDEVPGQVHAAASPGQGARGRRDGAPGNEETYQRESHRFLLSVLQSWCFTSWTKDRKIVIFEQGQGSSWCH